MPISLAILLFAIVVAILVAVPILGIGRKSTTKKLRNAGALDKVFVKNKWIEIEQMVSLGGPSHLKNSIMEADKLVDYALKARVSGGQTMGERLKEAQKLFSSKDDYNNLWYAHKVRNQIAHEAGYNLSPIEAKRAIGYFQKSLRILGAL